MENYKFASFNTELFGAHPIGRGQYSRSRPTIFRRISDAAVVLTTGVLLSACLQSAMANAEVLTLRGEAAASGILIGSGAINPSYLQDPLFAQVLAEQFNSLSPENELKWSRSEPQQGVFNFAPLDSLVEFAQLHGLKVKGHGLVSGGFNPRWLTQMTDPALVRAAISNHFYTIMYRYSGAMDRWDVVTEVFSTFGGSGLNQNFFYRLLGPDYIAELFYIAHAANPDAKLFLNESLVEYYPEKRQELYNLVSDLVARGVPIHGVGLETHMTLMPPPPGSITYIVKSYKALGLEVAITEMDAHVVNQPDYQAQIYKVAMTEAIKAGVKDISFWGFTDKHLYTWLPGAKPLMFDEEYNPKPAFFSTWTVLADKAFISVDKSMEVISNDVQALVAAGAVDARLAHKLMMRLNLAAKQFRATRKAAANVQSSISMIQDLVSKGFLPPRVVQGLMQTLDKMKLDLERQLTRHASESLQWSLAFVQECVDGSDLSERDGKGLTHELTWLLGKLS